MFLSITTLQAQYKGAPHGVSFKAGVLNYRFPLTDQLKGGEFTRIAELSYIRRINPILNVEIPLQIGQAEYPLTENTFSSPDSYISLDALVHIKYFKEPTFIWPYFFAGIGAIYEGNNESSFAVPLGVGLNFRLTKHVYLSTKGAYRVGLEDLRDHIDLTGGFTVLFGDGQEEQPPVVIDQDGDGVPDAQDPCPTTPGLLPMMGCPDQDEDGIIDKEDACPEVAGVIEFQGCPDTDGDGLADNKDECPEEAGALENNGCPLVDTDEDGVPDIADACPDEKGPATLGGCPDRDGDQVIDKEDVCPDVAGTVALKGCPDRDGDGLMDDVDKCPDKAGPEANDGCPEVEAEVIKKLEFATQAVQFETGRSTLKAESFAVLEEIVQILKTYTDYVLSIEGHTDSIGSATTNQSLSEKRAKACYDYMINAGIDASRLTYAGFGESVPIADNRYQAGREKNRRVEFKVSIE